MSTSRMLELRSAALAAGAQPLGWKVGFGAPAAMEMLGIDKPLVGFLTDRTLLPDGGTAHVGDWAKPMLEAEVAVRIGADGEIDGFAVAIELADVHPPPEDVDAILGGNIFHRHVLLGPIVEAPSDLRARLVRDGEELGRTDTPTELTGEHAETARVVGEVVGDELKPGEVIITGSIFPPLPVAPGQSVTVEIEPLGSLTVVVEA